MSVNIVINEYGLMICFSCFGTELVVVAFMLIQMMLLKVECESEDVDYIITPTIENVEFEKAGSWWSV